MRWPPHFERLVLEEGDATAAHTGAQGGARMGAADITQVPPMDVQAADQQWLRSNGIEWDGIAS
jgi:hypothetical protein